MTLRILIAYALTFSSFLVLGQAGFKREYKLPNSVDNQSKAVFETAPYNYLMGGTVQDTLGGHQFNRLALFGIDSSGQRTWMKKYGSPKFEYLDNSLIINWFYKQGNFLYHAGSVRDSNNKYLGVLIKFDFNGDTLWQKKFYDINYDVAFQRVTGSVDGGFLITGFFQDTTSQPALLIKTDVNGNELWRKKINKPIPNVSDGKAIVQDTLSKKIIIAGYQYIGNQYAWNNEDNIIICDSLGNKLNQLSYLGGLGGLFFDLIQTKDKKIVAVGNAIYPAIGSSNPTQSYIIKFDLNAPTVPLWKIYNFDKLTYGNSFTSIKEMKNGNLLIAGGIDTMRIDSLPVQSFNRITKMDQNGNVLWNRNYNYTKNPTIDNIECIMSLEIASNGDWLTAVEILDMGINPFFFVRYDSTGCDSSNYYCATVGIQENKKIEYPVSVYPNPVKSNIKLNFSGFTSKNISFKMLDVLGRSVQEKEIELEGKSISVSLDGFDSGVYFIQLFDNKKLFYTKKIIKE